MLNKLTKKTNKPKIPLNKLWNKIFYANLFSLYGLIILVLSYAFQLKAHNGHNQFVGNLTVSYLFLITGWLSSIGLCCLAYTKGVVPFQKKQFKEALLLSSIVPFIGFVSILVFKITEIKTSNKKLNKRTKYFHSLSSYTILFFSILVVVLIVWVVYIVSGGIVNKETHELYPVPGIIDVFLAPLQGFISAADLVVFLVIVGAYLQIVNQSKALEAGIGSLVKKMKNKEIWLIPILMIVFSIGGTTFGMCEETIPFFMILTPVMMAAGFDSCTSLLTIMLGAGVGTAGATLNPFIITVAIKAANDPATTVTTGILWRVIIYIVMMSFAIAFVTAYAIRVKKNPSKSIVYDLHKEHKEHFVFDHSVIHRLTHKRKIILGIFMSSFIVMILCVINWQGLTGWDGFEQFKQWLIINFPFFSTTFSSFGSWYLIEMAGLFFICAILVGAITWKDEENFLKTFMEGAKDYLGVAFIISVARGISVILTSSGINIILIDALKGIVNGSSPFLLITVLFGLFILLSFFIPSTSGFASAVFPTVGGALAGGATASISGAITTFSLASGLINLVSPTAGVFVASCTITKVPLERYFKLAWKFLIPLILIMLTMLLIGTTLPKGMF